uniref:C2H2-type domain-containing protein n=1 Tax=Poecilia formosa TaxID=48698 RepID=A0A096M3A7_POEFO
EEKNQRKSKYICKTCYKVLDTKKDLRAHERFQKKCKGCLKAFCFQNDVKCHKRVCAEYKKSIKTPSTRKFACKKCSYKTNSRKKFRRHKMSHSEKMQTSPVCQEILDEKNQITGKSIRRDGFRPPKLFACCCFNKYEGPVSPNSQGCVGQSQTLTCFRCFLSSAHFNRISVSLSSFCRSKPKMEMCASPILTTALPSLNPVYFQQSGRPYSCPYCTKCFTYPSHQRRHLLRHTGVRLHPCQFCDKSFLTPSELTVHTRTHTGERPFGCAQCGKRFARSGNLRAHQRDVHMGKRPFACVECGKRFAHRGNLRVHN